MLRVPETYRNRWGYALAAFVGALPPGLFILQGLNWPMPERLLSLGTIFLIPPVLACLIWPKRNRTGFGMAFRGLAIVGITIASISIVDTIMVIRANEALGGSYGGILVKIDVILSGVSMAIMIGTIVTLGLPWIIGVFASLLFADRQDD